MARESRDRKRFLKIPNVMSSNGLRCALHRGMAMIAKMLLASPQNVGRVGPPWDVVGDCGKHAADRNLSPHAG